MPRWEEIGGEVAASLVAGEPRHPYADSVLALERLEGFPGDPTTNQACMLAACALALDHPSGLEWCWREARRHQAFLGAGEPGADYAKFLLGGWALMALEGPADLRLEALRLMRAELLFRALFAVEAGGELVSSCPGIRIGSLSAPGITLALWRALDGRVAKPRIGSNWRRNQRRSRIAWDALELHRLRVLSSAEQDACVDWIQRTGPPDPVLAALRGSARWKLRTEIAIDARGNLDAWAPTSWATDNQQPAVTLGRGRVDRLRPSLPPLGFRGTMDGFERLMDGSTWLYRCRFEGVQGDPHDRGDWPRHSVARSMVGFAEFDARRFALGPDGVEGPIAAPRPASLFEEGAPTPPSQPLPPPDHWGEVASALDRALGAARLRRRQMVERHLASAAATLKLL